jgi:hypothetical protein
MAHKFTIILDGKLTRYENYEDIPESFDNLIEFLPEIPPGPHTDEQHEEIEGWSYKLAELLKRETK